MAADRERIRWLPLKHPCLTAMRQMDVQIGGMDERQGTQIWGEGITDTTLLFLVVRGSVMSIGEGTPLPVDEGECLVVPAGRAKRLQLRRGSLCAVWVHLLNVARWTHLLGAVRKYSSVGQPALFGELVESLLQETLSGQKPTELGTSIGQSLAAVFNRNFGVNESPFKRETRLRLNRLWELVSSQVAHGWTTRELAARMHVSVSQLHRIVREFHEDQPMKIVTRMRLQQAAQLLVTTRLTLDEIADATAYTTAYALSDAFVREMGVRPGAYRRG